MFADRYIQKNMAYPAFIGVEPLPSVSMIVMIPCLNEPEIVRTLESVWSCTPPKSVVEVIVAVNDSESSSEAVKEFNRKTYEDLKIWKIQNDRPNLILHPIYAESVTAKHAGAGMARKIGMDEAVRHFNFLNKPEGVIISLDSDCLVSPNYLVGIEAYFEAGKSNFATTLNFRHRLEELGDERQRRGIRLYEDYLHYYKKAHDFAGFPNSIYTIGSAFAVRAGAYVAQGGMNRRQAGEDFYFLNKLTSLGKVGELNEVFVYPSARVSDRVPFGTGAAITKWMNDEGDLTMTYHFSAFQDLKKLFDSVDGLYRIDDETLDDFMGACPPSLQEYFELIRFREKVEEINQNSSNLISFRKRFFQFFDAFVIMRFLNESHPAFYSRQELAEANGQLDLMIK